LLPLERPRLLRLNGNFGILFNSVTPITIPLTYICALGALKKAMVWLSMIIQKLEANLQAVSMDKHPKVSEPPRKTQRGQRVENS
jgi:hypothetical protein